MSSVSSSIDEWVSTQRQLLNIELEYENSLLAEKISRCTAHECQDLGLSLLMLNIDEVKTSLFGRTTLTVVSHRGAADALLSNSFKTGDEVVLYSMKKRSVEGHTEDGKLAGVITKSSNNSLDIVVEEYDEEALNPPLRLDLRSNEYTHKKMICALEEIISSPNKLVNHLLQPSLYPDNRDVQLSSEALISARRLSYFNPDLNESQREAVACALNAPLISIIHGPVRIPFALFI